MDDLVAFLAARLDEDEAEAKATADADAEFWADVRGDGTHFARHDPARVLREVAAVRAILAEIRSELADDPAAVMPQDRLRCLAAVYGDHPDYRQEWGPSGG